MDTSKHTIEESLKQCSKPTGDIGIEYGRNMNEYHKPLIKWGLSTFFDSRELIDNVEILDAGCGAGLAINIMAETVSECNITGIDYSDDMVNAARKFNKNLLESGRVTIHKSSVEKLPFDDNKFDVVTATETIYFWPDLFENVKEVYRTLKDDGSFVVINEDYYREGCELIPHCKAMIESDYAQLHDENELLELFESTGFKDIKINAIPSKGWITVSGTKRINCKA
ncbi:MAG TPA: class I SAM-dependent methyltransferase [Victivallales bacterium]|nr:class I SAM-dependent methyltransferase [Victivallales bacterium]